MTEIPKNDLDSEKELNSPKNGFEMILMRDLSVKDFSNKKS